jgi:fatty-acyl-CoA synthase
MHIPLTPIRFLDRATRLFGKNTAVVCEDSRFTYAEFGERVERLANALVDLGVKPGDRVAYLGFNCHRLLECYYGILKMGAILLPLNIRLATQDIEYILNDAEPVVVFVHPNFISKLAPILSSATSVKSYYLLEGMENSPEWVSGEYDALLDAASTQPKYSSFNFPFEENDTAELFYTSGTTGPPKGVMLTHRNLYIHAIGLLASMPLWEKDIQLHLIPLFHVNGWGTPHYLTAKGGTHVMLKTFDPAKALELVQREKVTKFYIVPTMMTMMLELPNLSSFDLSSMQDILIGGAPPPTGMCAHVESVFGCQVHGAFGMSETCPVIAYPELHSGLDEATFKHRAHETWGFPVIGVEYKVVDTMDNELPWDGESVGELLVRGDLVMKGYWNKPEATARAIEGGWFHTGDLVSMGPDGSLIIRDRAKDIIISGGENISSLEIEQVLYSHPDILECAVIGTKDLKWGEVPKAVVVAKPGSNLTGGEVVEFTRERLAHFKALRSAEVVSELPKGGSGKILKKKIRELYG